MTALDNRPSLRFEHDPSDGLGHVFGPTLNNELLVMAEVIPDGDGFRAFYRYAVPADLPPKAYTITEVR